MRYVLLSILHVIMEGKARKYSIGHRFWIQETEGHFLGRGRVQLLENIKKLGSITQAAKAMKMSYRQAWQMIEDLNKRSDKVLVEKILGGIGGGGAKVTKAGDDIIKMYYKLEEKVKAYIEKESGKLKF